MNALTLATLPNIGDARLPDTYQKAVSALEAASEVDECKLWADKAMALASYARQSRDDRMYKMAVRIQGRATRRCGELLAMVLPAPGRPRAAKNKADDHPNLSREQVAADAGMSPHQRKTALRVAAVPKAIFERQIESDAPPTVTALAQQGKKARALVNLDGIPPADFRAATELMGSLRRLAEYCQSHDAARVAGSFRKHERRALRENISMCDAWLDTFAQHLPE